VTEPVTTGSGIERTVECGASAVLPRIYAASSTYAARGTDVHAFLERIANGMPAAESCSWWPRSTAAPARPSTSTRSGPSSSCLPEVALAYNPVTDTARVLGQSLERDYSSITEDEWPLTIDLAGLAPDRAYVEATGRPAGCGCRAPAATGRCAAPPSPWPAPSIATRSTRPSSTCARARWPGATAPASMPSSLPASPPSCARSMSGSPATAPPTPPARASAQRGAWCRYCPSFWSCPAKAALVRWALTGEADRADVADRPRRRARSRRRRDQGARAGGEADPRRWLEDEPKLIEVGPDGVETWLGRHPKQGNEKLDPRPRSKSPLDVLDVPADQRVTFINEITSVSKKALEAAAKKRVAKGRAARRSG
jgi:hypothetical protein